MKPPLYYKKMQENVIEIQYQKPTYVWPDGNILLKTNRFNIEIRKYEKYEKYKKGLRNKKTTWYYMMPCQNNYIRLF